MVEAAGPFRRRGGTMEEVQMEEAFIFSQTIKDLKALRPQLYSAAEYFELAYTQEGGKQAVMSNLKEYAVKALINTVDHLGSISFKVSSLVDQKLDEVAEANLRASCIQQRAQTIQACVNREGLTQQSLVITAPKYHKRYILPGDGSVPNAVPNFSEMNKAKSRTTQMHQAAAAASAAQTKNKDKQASFRKLRSIARAPSQSARSSSPAQHPRFVPPSDTAIPTKRDKRSDSPMYSTTPLTRSGSLSKKSSLLKTSSVRVQMQTTSDPKRLVPLRSYADRYNDDSKESDQTLKKSKKFLKSLLSRRKSGKEEPLQDSVP
uniref:Protein ABIL1 n=1 Tax=Aegilops tauschii subsp. strangulata TaxID=200361 RepID=A0A452XS08_AEGTS